MHLKKWEWADAATFAILAAPTLNKAAQWLIDKRAGAYSDCWGSRMFTAAQDQYGFAIHVDNTVGLSCATTAIQETIFDGISDVMNYFRDEETLACVRISLDKLPPDLVSCNNKDYHYCKFNESDKPRCNVVHSPRDEL